MKKTILLLFILSGCQFIKSTRATDRQSIKFSKIPASFEIVNNRILLKNGVNFCLDIGAPNVIFNSRFGKFKITDSTTNSYLIDVNGNKIKNKNITIRELKNPFFTITNGTFKSLNDELKCPEIKGLIGPELFQHKVICIDFERNEIKIMPDRFDSTEYNQAEITGFDGHYFKIKLKINGKMIVAKLDTGNPYDLVLKNEDYQKIKINERVSYFDSKGKIEKLFSSENSIEIGIKSSNQIIVKSNKFIKRNLIGVGFMKNYNWCLDYRNGKVYYKKVKENNLDIAKQSNINQF